MFVRHLKFSLKANVLKDYATAFENEVIPMLRQQPGFRDMITLADPDGKHVIGLSFWDTHEQAQSYNEAVYPQILSRLEKFLDGQPELRVLRVLNSTPHKVSAQTSAAA